MMNIDLLIVCFFLAALFVSGLYYGKGIKTFEGYALSNRNLSTFVLTVSLIATTYGGTILDSRIDGLYRKGFYLFLFHLASPLNYYLASRFVLVRMKEFMGHCSVAESMGSLYGQTVRMLSAIFGILMTMALIAAQFKVGMRIVTLLVPEMGHISVLTGIFLGLFVILYASFGGARAVALTDVFQFFLFGACLPVLICALFYFARDPWTEWTALIHRPAFDLKRVFTWDDALRGSLMYFLWRSVFPFDPARIQRFYMSSSIQQATTVFTRSAWIRVAIAFFFLLLAVALHVGGHVVPTSQNALEYLTQLSYFPGMRGMLVASIVALLMSTADSNLHAASILYTNDILAVFKQRTNKVYKPSLKTVRIASVCIGLLSLVLVVHTTNVWQLASKTVHFYGPSVTVPLILASFGFRPRPAAVLWTMIVNTALTAYRIFYEGRLITQQSVFLSLVGSACMLLLFHYTLPKEYARGWVGIRDRSPLELQTQETKRWWMTCWRKTRSMFTYDCLAARFPRKESTFAAFGFYVVATTFLALLSLREGDFVRYVYGYIAVMAVGTVIMVYPSLHSYRPGGNKFTHLAWPILLFGLLFVSGIQFAALGHFTPILCTLCVGNLAIASIFMPLRIVCLFSVLTCLGYRCLPGTVPVWSTAWTNWTLADQPAAYLVAMGSIACISQLYRCMRDRAQAKQKTWELARSYERRSSLQALHNQQHWSKIDPTYGATALQEMSQLLEEPCAYLLANGREALGNAIRNFRKKLHAFGQLLAQREKEERSLALNPQALQKVQVETSVEQAYQNVRDLDVAMRLLLRNESNVQSLLTDPTIFERLLTINFLAMAKSIQAKEGMLTCTIADTQLCCGGKTDERTGQDAPTLPALALCLSTDATLRPLQPLYHVGNGDATACLPKGEDELYRAESSRIVDAHGGCMEITETNAALTCLYVLPVAGKNTMRLKRCDQNGFEHPIAETPESKEQEVALTALLVAQTPLSKEMVEKTIAFIKNAHGNGLRPSGEPHYTHPMEVTKLLLEVTQDPDTLLAGLLHDVVEHTPVRLSQLEVRYGSEVVRIVDAATRCKHYIGHPWKLCEETNKNLLDACNDLRVVYVKLADRLHNLRTLETRGLAEQKRMARDTLTFYIPWGKKHKVEAWLTEMQRICQNVLDQTS